MWTNEFVPASVISPKAVFITCLLVQQYCDNPSWKNGRKKKTTWVEACLQNTKDKFAIFKHQMIINVCAQKKLQYLPASLNTLWVIIILTNWLSLLLLFVSKLVSISVEILLGTFINLVSMKFRGEKIRKLVHRERRTLPNKFLIVGYDATEFMTSSKMAATLTATILEPISRQK